VAAQEKDKVSAMTASVLVMEANLPNLAVLHGRSELSRAGAL
jgi:hypothetical protein